MAPDQSTGNSMERIWNLLHYMAYRGFCWSFRQSTKFEPAGPLLRMRRVKEFYRRRGIEIADLNAAEQEAILRPDIGLAAIWAAAFVFGVPAYMCGGLLFLYQAALRVGVRLDDYDFVLFTVVLLALNYFLLYRHDKYLRYFKEFDRMPKREKIKWGWITAAVAIGTVLFFAGSMALAIYTR